MREESAGECEGDFNGILAFGMEPRGGALSVWQMAFDGVIALPPESGWKLLMGLPLECRHEAWVAPARVVCDDAIRRLRIVARGASPSKRQFESYSMNEILEWNDIHLAGYLKQLGYALVYGSGGVEESFTAGLLMVYRQVDRNPNS
ncbi:hypothetical protein [Pelagicoccus sp. SDUM812002]|uniref:hypothetical protein n=1 Tax=Pelagicoccus sp. SDUM812002 TaxID=3041266 RepID=UPI00280D20A5|nr:hypothetical protein [Pelagicoccus sp. SDUM812002]MDQ8184622.1 hypothetical protein [Pelagicoccus sp. SDUM812002]